MNHFRAQNGTIFNYNSDMSGKVHVSLYGRIDSAMEIEGSDLLEFVAQFVIDSKISKLEQSSPDEALGL